MPTSLTIPSSQTRSQIRASNIHTWLMSHLLKVMTSQHFNSMPIDVSVQCNSGFLPDMMLLTQLLLPLGNLFKCHEEVLSLQPDPT